jgi:hypothetical protein
MGLVGDNALYPNRTLPTLGHEDSEYLGYSAYYTNVSNHMQAGVNPNNPDNPTFHWSCRWWHCKL